MTQMEKDLRISDVLKFFNARSIRRRLGIDISSFIAAVKKVK